MNSNQIITGFFKKGNDYFCIRDDHRSFEPCLIEEIKNLDYFHALEKEYKHNATGENVFKFNYGPSTGGMVETVDFKIYTYGERILSVDIFPEFKRREIKITREKLDNALLKMERLNGFHSFSYSTLLCSSLERLLGIGIPDDVRIKRILLMETERIISHIFKTARLCEAASQNIASYQLMALREKMMRSVAEITGHRYMFGINKIGGLYRDFESSRLVQMAREAVREYSQIRDGLYFSRIFIDRIENTCKISVPFSRGPTMRASGYAYDYRKMDPYYADLDFSIVTENGGDSLARFQVFAGEIETSLEIMEKAIEQKKGGDFMPELVENEIFGVETPSGDARMFLEMEDNRISNIYLRTPSMLNLEAFARGICGNVKTDIPFAYESFGIWIGELGELL